MSGMRRVSIVVGVTMALLAAWATSASAAGNPDPTIIARNILPSGQYGTAGPERRRPGDRCTTRSPRSSTTSPRTTCSRTSSPRSSSVDTDGPTTQESVPFPGVTLLRDRFNVPHVYAEHPRRRHRDGRLDPRRGPRPAARAGPLQLARRRHRRPGLSAIGLTAGLQSFKPSAETEAVRLDGDQGAEAGGQGGQGRPARHRQLRRRASTPTWRPPTRPTLPGPATTSTPSTPSRASSSARAAAARRRTPSSSTACSSSSARAAASRPSTTCASSRTRAASPRVNGTFPYGHIPRKHPGSVVLDNDSFTPTPAVPASIARKYVDASPCRPATS